MTKKRCDYEGCNKVAKWKLLLEARASGADEFNDPYQTMEVNFLCCNDCKKKIKLENILTDESWKNLCLLFAKLNIKQPDRERIRLLFRSVTY